MIGISSLSKEASPSPYVETIKTKPWIKITNLHNNTALANLPSVKIHQPYISGWRIGYLDQLSTQLLMQLFERSETSIFQTISSRDIPQEWVTNAKQ